MKGAKKHAMRKMPMHTKAMDNTRMAQMASTPMPMPGMDMMADMGTGPMRPMPTPKTMNPKRYTTHGR